jgi:uncharacterized protein (TIGR00299 family) protein
MNERLLYWDCVGGAAGDMLLASLIDLGVPVESIWAAVQSLGLHEVRLETVTDYPAGLRALRVDVMIRGGLADASGEWTPLTATGESAGEHRSYAAIKSMLDDAPLPEPVRTTAQAVFRRLAEAEAKVHGIEVEKVEFHEVGSDDALVDVVGVAAALHELGVDRVVASPLPLGRGIGQSAHGPVPLPAPATLALLEGIPVDATDLKGETVTPTGAALLRTIVDTFGPLPTMNMGNVGIGCGHKSWPDRPNVVRAIYGEAVPLPGTRTDECVVEANLDDIIPAHVPLLLEALMEAGALDVWSEAILMKKGRPGQRVGALVARSGRDAVVSAFFQHSPTLGVRWYDVERSMLPRRIVTVETRFGDVRVKVAEGPGFGTRCVPEFEDCRVAADAHGVAVRDVFDAALAAAVQIYGGSAGTGNIPAMDLDTEI